jgi:SP family myo-inositol transporter-like MFS transporter 13
MIQLTGFVIFLSLTAAVSGFCFGYDTGVISASLVSIKDDLGHILNAQEKEWISSATSVGALFGYVNAVYRSRSSDLVEPSSQVALRTKSAENGFSLSVTSGSSSVR